MRVPVTLAVLIAGTLVHHSRAQAIGYDSHDSNEDGNPNSDSDGISDKNAYGAPSGISNGSPTGTPGVIPNASPDELSCALQGTTTVFITVSPASPLNSPSSHESDDADSDQTVIQTSYPTKTILISPVASAQAEQTSVKPFTTITIDIWGEGSASNAAPVATDIPSAPIYSDDVPTQVEPSATSPDASAASTQDPWSNSMPAGDSGLPGTQTNGQTSIAGEDTPGPGATSFPANSPYGEPSGHFEAPASLSQASAASFSSAIVVTDTDVHWISGSGGPTQVTIVSLHTLTFGPSPIVTQVPDESVSRVTFTGPDGKPTIVEYPGGQPGSNNDAPQPLSASSTVASLPSITNGSLPDQNDPVGAVETSCTSFTIIGPNGIPTIVHSSWVVSPAATTPAPSGLSPGFSQTGDANEGTVNGLGTTTCTTYTVLGPDGLPTVVESTWPLPATVNSESALAQSTPRLPSPALSGIPSQITSGPSPAQPGGPGGREVGGTTCTTYTVLGPDGLPTVVETTWAVPNPTAVDTAPTIVITGLPPNQASNFPGFPSHVINTAAGVEAGFTTSTTYTILGQNGLPTIVATTWFVPNPPATNGAPNNVVSSSPTQLTGFPGFPTQTSNGIGHPGSVTSCTSYTVLGPDGLPTIVESTFVVPASTGLPEGTGVGLPSSFPSVTGLPQGIPQFNPGNVPVTTCITVNVLGPNGAATPVVQTVIFTPSVAGNALPAQTSVRYPSLVPEQDSTDLPQGIPHSLPRIDATTTCITVDVLGLDGIVTPVVQTVVLTPSISALGLPTAQPLTGVPSTSTTNVELPGGASNVAGIPGLSGYGTSAAGSLTILPPSAVVSGIANELSTVTGTHTSFLTIIANPQGSSGLPPPYSDQWANAAPGSGSTNQLPQNGYGSLPVNSADSVSPVLYEPLQTVTSPGLPHVLTALQTSTWANVIPEQTTTYTINFPLTTLATLTLPNKRAFRRQQSSLTSESAWGNSSSTSDAFSENTSLVESLSSALGGEATLPPLTTAPDFPQTSATIVEPTTPSLCPKGGKVGNHTLDFDDVRPGPLFNPSSDIWFSEGFLIAPPSSESSPSYIPSSGGQLVEFVPPSLSSKTPFSSTGDTAEIGVGPNAPNSCFRFDFQGANLGCAAEGSEKWCEFEISAYTYNEGTAKEESIAWSETKRVPACSNFPHGTCQLTPVQFDGYMNLTSVLISLHVGLELRVWWGDDLKVGWTDSSCEAATCRANAVPHPVKRETVESVARRGVWRWTPQGLKRLDDEYIWESAH